MNKIVLFSVCITVFSGFVSCGDTYILYTSSINNQTKNTISIYFHSKTASVQGCDSVICPPYTKNEYYKSKGRVNHINKDKNIASCDPQINKSEVEIIVSNNKMLRKDISNKNKWTCETDNWNSYCETSFIITEDDLE